METPLQLLKLGFDTGINNLKKDSMYTQVQDIKNHDKILVDLFISACNSFYNIGYDVGAKMHPYFSNDFLINAVMEDIAYKTINYVLGMEQADGFREQHYLKLTYLFN